jgi:acyl dehydratase
VADDTTTSGPRILDGADEIRDAVGTHLGYSEWVLVTQERVNRFADATGDHQWIHVDVERAERESPYGGTIAHGYLTMSMSNELVPQVVRMTGFAMGINYGVDKVRFPSAVKVGSRIRAGVVIADVTDVAGGIQVKMAITIEVEGSDKPACVIESLARWVA